MFYNPLIMTKTLPINSSFLPPLNRLATKPINYFLASIIPLLILATLWKQSSDFRKFVVNTLSRTATRASDLVPAPRPSAVRAPSSSISASSSSRIASIFPENLLIYTASNFYLSVNQMITTAHAQREKGAFELKTLPKETTILSSHDLIGKSLPDQPEDLIGLFQWHHFVQNLQESNFPSRGFKPETFQQTLQRQKQIYNIQAKAKAILQKQFPGLDPFLLESMLKTSTDLDLKELTLGNAKEYLLFMLATKKDPAVLAATVQHQIKAETDFSIESLKDFVALLPKDLQGKMLDFLAQKLTLTAMNDNPFKPFYDFKQMLFDKVQLNSQLEWLKIELDKIKIVDFRTYLFWYQLKKEFGNLDWIATLLTDLIYSGGLSAVDEQRLPNEKAALQKLLNAIGQLLDCQVPQIVLDQDTSNDSVLAQVAQFT
ncbi:MAG: hypothetical protein K940chlam8_00167 [Chlamydiae bacterium]|nr:hypothetical protein [Chlamydiota bacterium]